MESSMLDEAQNNYIASAYYQGDKVGICFVFLEYHPVLVIRALYGLHGLDLLFVGRRMLRSDPSGDELLQFGVAARESAACRAALTSWSTMAYLTSG